jgi:phosphohistidine phosphatase
MKQLLLLRHAEAQLAVPGGSDAERVLTDEGTLEALQAAQCLRTADVRLDAVLVSDARRTLQTAQILTNHLKLRIAADPQAALYLAAPQTLLQALRQCNEQHRTVLLIGHNPGISELAQLLTGSDAPLTLRTAGLCQIVLPAKPWKDLEPAAARTFAILR